jgi:hypothetical protein
MQLAHNFDVQLDNQKFNTRLIPSGSNFRFNDQDKIDINHIVTQVSRQIQASSVQKSINVDKRSNSKCLSYHLTGRTFKKKADLLNTLNDKERVKFWLVLFQHVNMRSNHVKLYSESNRFLETYSPIIRRRIEEIIPSYAYSYFPQSPWASLHNTSSYIQFPNMGDTSSIDELRDYLRQSINGCQLMKDEIYHENGGSVRLIEFEAKP